MGPDSIIMELSYKVCFIGGPKTGKTTFLLRHSTGEFRQESIPTKGASVSSLSFQTTEGKYNLKIWDIGGQPELEGLGEGYYIQADAAVAFYDKDNVVRTNDLVTNFKRINPGVPIINVWNKCDQPEEAHFVKVNLRRNYPLIRQGNRLTYQVSALSNYNFEKPFLEILRMLTKKPELCFSDCLTSI